MWLLFATSAFASLCAPGETGLIDCSLDDGGAFAFCAAASTPQTLPEQAAFLLRRSDSAGQVGSLRLSRAQIGDALVPDKVLLAVHDSSGPMHLDAVLVGEPLRAVQTDRGWELHTQSSGSWTRAASCDTSSNAAVGLGFLPTAHDRALYRHLNDQKEALHACVGYASTRKNARFDVQISPNGTLGATRQVRGSQKLIQCAQDSLKSYRGPATSGVARVWVHALRDRTRAGATGSLSDIHRETTAADDLERSVDDSLVLGRCRDALVNSAAVKFQILIDAQGRVEGRGDVRPDSVNEEATLCVAKAITGLRVPAPGRAFSGRGVVQYGPSGRTRLDVSTADM